MDIPKHAPGQIVPIGEARPCYRIEAGSRNGWITKIIGSVLEVMWDADPRVRKLFIPGSDAIVRAADLADVPEQLYTPARKPRARR